MTSKNGALRVEADEVEKSTQAAADRPNNPDGKVSPLPPSKPEGDDAAESEAKTEQRDIMKMLVRDSKKVATQQSDSTVGGNFGTAAVVLLSSS